MKTHLTTDDAILDGLACPRCRQLFGMTDRTRLLAGLRYHRDCGERVKRALRTVAALSPPRYRRRLE